MLAKIPQINFSEQFQLSFEVFGVVFFLFLRRRKSAKTVFIFTKVHEIGGRQLIQRSNQIIIHFVPGNVPQRDKLQIEIRRSEQFEKSLQKRVMILFAHFEMFHSFFTSFFKKNSDNCSFYGCASNMLICRSPTKIRLDVLRFD